MARKTPRDPKPAAPPRDNFVDVVQEPPTRFPTPVELDQRRSADVINGLVRCLLGASPDQHGRYKLSKNVPSEHRAAVENAALADGWDVTWDAQGFPTMTPRAL